MKGRNRDIDLKVVRIKELIFIKELIRATWCHIEKAIKLYLLCLRIKVKT